MKYSLKYSGYALLLFLVVFGSACTKEDVMTPVVNTMVPDKKEIADNKGFPGSIIRADGTGLGDIKTITFKAKSPADAKEVNVIFNPVLNSNQAIFFPVPYDETKGSLFGMQVVTLTNTDGNSVTKDFEILQPKPTIASFTPERPKANQKVVVVGEWFQNVISVKFKSKTVVFEQIDTKSVSFTVPDGTTLGDLVTIETKGGKVDKFLDIDLGYNVYKYMDFDGGGMYAANSWRNNGDITDAVIFSNTNGKDGNYAQITWSGSKTNGWGNAEPTSGGKPGIKETDQSKVFCVFDVYCVSAVGSSMQVQIDDGTTVWAHDHTFTADEVGKWITVKMSCYDFGAGYNPANQTHDMDIKNITYMKIGINNWTGVVPTTVRIDNVRFFGYY